MKTAVSKISPSTHQALLERCERAIIAGRRIREELLTTLDVVRGLREQQKILRQEAIGDEVAGI